jgi:ABC-type methionine transport system ATPase subunit
MVGIESALFDRSGSALSVGQQQRVCLARALYLRPKVLMMDETTASLDPNLAAQVLANLIDYSKKTGMTLLHVTHQMKKLRLADQVVLLDNGSVAEMGPPSQLLDNPTTENGRKFFEEFDAASD